MFQFDLSDQLRSLIKKLAKKDRIRITILNKKIKEVINNDSNSIDKYKNLKHDLNEYKRVHIDKSFVLLFKVHKDKNMIFFWKLEHHDKVYKK